MIMKNYYSGSIKVDSVTKSATMQDVELLPSCHKVIITNLASAGGATDIVKVEASPYSDFALVTKGGTSGATATTRIANTFLSNSNKVYAIDPTAVAVGANVITITTKTALPTTLVGAPVRIRFSAKDPLSLVIPSMMYISVISGTSVNIQLDKVSTWPAASVAASGIEVLSSSVLKKNLPAHVTAVTVTGDKAVLHGSFPSAKVLEGSTVAINSHDACVSPSYKGKEESLRFVVESSDASAGTITITSAKGKLITMAAGSQILSVSIDKETGFGFEHADEEAFYNKSAPVVSLADAGFAVGDELLVEQYIAG